jgi:subtilisin-like proprotein convertase family protein
LKIEAIEHVEVEVSLNFSPRAIMEMYIISPYGTRSQLLYKRMFDALSSRKDYKGLVVASLHFWGENPAGEWTVLFKAAESMSSLGRSYGR